MVQVNNLPYITVRVMFKKTGDLQYISHLDLVRTMHKIIVRAELPLWYSEGFNPKPKMIFAAPLSIGTESVCEFVDIRLTERLDTEDIKTRLNRNLTDEMQALSVYYPESKLTDLKWIMYAFDVRSKGLDATLLRECEELFKREELFVEKKNKKGELVKVDIRPLIKSISFGLLDGELKISAVLSGDASCFLNPEHIIKILKRELGLLSSPDITEESYSIMRLKALREDMTEFR